MFFDERFRADRHSEGYNKRKRINTFSYVCKGISIDVVGVSSDTKFEKIRPGDGVETGDSFKKS